MPTGVYETAVEGSSIRHKKIAWTERAIFPPKKNELFVQSLHFPARQSQMKRSLF
jgi:hypothetical protein